MINQVIRLSRLQLANLFGINELRYTRDKAKKARYIGLAVVWAMLILMIVGYVGGFSYGMVFLGMPEIIPLYLYAVASLLILIFSFFKAGSVIFSMKGYEMLVSLPVSKSAIVISRFGSMYVTNVLLGLLIMLPGMVVYGYFARPTVWFYVIFLLGSLFLPLLPLTISSILGAGITAISSRVKRKSLVETALMLIVIVGIMAFSMFATEKEDMLQDVDFLKNMAGMLSSQISGIYPPALWFADALTGEPVALCLLFGVPTVVFVGFILILQRYFQAICTAINAVTAKNDYKMTSLRVSGQVTALWKRELKRYFSSSVYVTNTIVGYVLAMIFAVGICIMGVEQLETFLTVSNLEPILARYLPYGLACLITMTSITGCSISLEGNTFWQIQTLPVKARQVYDSKILMNLTVAAPFYLVSVIALGMTVSLRFLEWFWLFTIPAAYLLFACVLGITVNLAFPVFNWESEVRVVKQSMTTFLCMLIGMISSATPLIVSVFIEEQFSSIMNIVVLLGVLILTGILYIHNNKKELRV